MTTATLSAPASAPTTVHPRTDFTLALIENFAQLLAEAKWSGDATPGEAPLRIAFTVNRSTKVTIEIPADLARTIDEDELYELLPAGWEGE